MSHFRHPVVQALLTTIIALWVAGGIAVSAEVRGTTWALLAFAVAVALAAWWRVARERRR